jgi:hypothetical protein
MIARRTAALALAMLCAPWSSASAGIGAGGSVDFPSSVVAGSNGIPASVSFLNLNTPPDQTTGNVVSGIGLLPSCGLLGGGSQCTLADPGVFQPSATATGRVGTACAGTTFTVTLADATFGVYAFTPNVPIVLGASGSICTIDFTVDVLRVPGIDADPGSPGIQTAQVVEHTQTPTVGPPAFVRATDLTTVSRATPTISTLASPDVTLGAGQLSDQATVSGLVSPGASTVTFRLHGPDDVTCAAVVFTDTAALTIVGTTGTAQSGSFTPTAAGTYRWIATYDGDANNQPVAGACNEASENVTVLGVPTATPEPSATPTSEPTATPTSEPSATPTPEPTTTPEPTASSDGTPTPTLAPGQDRDEDDAAPDEPIPPDDDELGAG